MPSSSASSSESGGEDGAARGPLLYSEREEWRDVTPIPQDDGPLAVSGIQYSQLYADAFGYLRAVMKSGELSARALELCTTAIRLNPSHYTAWQYRRDVIAAIGADLAAELEFTAEIVAASPKNYQLWHHRQWCVERLGDCTGELEFTEDALADDNKNYHVWSYRQWVVRTYGLWAQELEFVERMIADDIRNNSAWNERYYVIRSTRDLGDSAVRATELAFTRNQVEKAPHNEAPWSYVRGVFAHDLQNEELRAFCAAMTSSVPTCPFAWSLLADIEEDAVVRAQDNARKHVAAAAAAAALERLAAVDPVRTRYWLSRVAHVRSLVTAE